MKQINLLQSILVLGYFLLWQSSFPYVIHKKEKFLTVLKAEVQAIFVLALVRESWPHHIMTNDIMAGAHPP